MKIRVFLIGFLASLAILSCSGNKEELPPVSTKDPLPLPEAMARNKDLSVKPGDSFYDYCNGSWLRNTPIPASGSVGVVYDQVDAMKERVEQLKASVPDIGKFYQLMEASSGQPELSKTFQESLKAKYDNHPASREDAFRMIGRMLADGFPMWGSPMIPAWNLIWKDGRLMGTIIPFVALSPGSLPDIDPAQYVPLSSTKAGEEQSAASLIVEGMGKDKSLFVIDPSMSALWSFMDNMTLEQLSALIDKGLAYYDQFCSAELNDEVRLDARFSVSYVLSYYFALKFIPSALKEKFLGITKEIKASLRQRIQKVEWMSETTRNNALDKLDYCVMNVAYPDQWYKDCIPDLSDCGTLVEAVWRNNFGIARLKEHLLGGKDTFSSMLISGVPGSDAMTPTDLTLVNAMYAASYNCVFIYPAFILPPIIPENVSQAYEYAMFVVIGHEFTHGFDSAGSTYDKFGNKKNWWTIADKMDFEQRTERLVQCHNHLELDPLRRPDVYNDGEITLAENIADLGGFLTVLDAYKTRLDADGYSGETYNEQLRKFYESYADLWRTQYSDTRLDLFPKKDVHSHGRLRVNGVVMNTDLWYELYGIDRNNILYLPPELRTHIW